jgi:hypothetical protein
MTVGRSLGAERRDRIDARGTTVGTAHATSVISGSSTATAPMVSGSAAVS